MLKVNVGLSRKLSKDYNSEGFSINVEGEVSAAVNDPQAVVEQVKELYDLAEGHLPSKSSGHRVRRQSPLGMRSPGRHGTPTAMAVLRLPKRIGGLPAMETAMATSPMSPQRTSRSSSCCRSANGCGSRPRSWKARSNRFSANRSACTTSRSVRLPRSWIS